MIRTLLFLVIFGASLFLAVAAVDFLRLDRALGGLFEALFGSFSDADTIAMIGLVGLGTAWLAYGIAMSVTNLRQRLLHSVAAWPLAHRPTASFFLRTGVFALATMIFMIVVSVVDPSGVAQDIVLLIFAVIGLAYVGMVLRDFHGLLLNPDLVGNTEGNTSDKRTSGWILPASITQEMLGKPELRFELAKDLRNRAANMRRFSFIALAGIAALLVVAVNVILFAGFIANLGVGVTGPERIQQLLDSETLALDNIQTSLRNLDARLVREEMDFHRAKFTSRANIRNLDDKNILPENRELFRRTDAYQDYLI